MVDDNVSGLLFVSRLQHIGHIANEGKTMVEIGVALCTTKSVSDLLLCPLRDYADASVLDFVLPGDIEQHGRKA